MVTFGIVTRGGRMCLGDSDTRGKHVFTGDTGLGTPLHTAKCVARGVSVIAELLVLRGGMSHWQYRSILLLILITVRIHT